MKAYGFESDEGIERHLDAVELFGRLGLADHVKNMAETIIRQAHVNNRVLSVLRQRAHEEKTDLPSTSLRWAVMLESVLIDRGLVEEELRYDRPLEEQLQRIDEMTSRFGIALLAPRNLPLRRKRWSDWIRETLRANTASSQALILHEGLIRYRDSFESEESFQKEAPSFIKMLVSKRNAALAMAQGRKN